MKLSDLRRISKYKHISEISETEAILSLGLYDSLLIDTEDIRSYYKEIAGGERRFLYDEVSQDVKAFHQFLMAKDTIELPCPYCGKTQPYSVVGWFNPRKLNEDENRNRQDSLGRGFIPFVNSIHDDEEQIKDRPYLERVHYRISQDHFEVTPRNAFDDKTQQDLIDFDKKQYYQMLAEKCVNGILDVAEEVRKDYKCAMNPQHHCFIGFAMERAVNDKPDELKEYEQKLSVTPEVAPNAEEKEALELYERLKHTVIMRKVSQFPSMADLQLFDIEKYRKVLKNLHKDYRMALGLYASGVGAGSLVYLRRILESIIEEVHQECKADPNWNENDYQHSRFNEKIELFEKQGKEIFPSELKPIKNKIYGVLSKGIHESSEDDCKSIFPDLKDAIDLFLDAKIAKLERAKRIKELNTRIQNVKM